jgi:hypothetical protein
VGNSTTRYLRCMSRERTVNWACLAPFSLAICRFIQCFPDRTCSTTVLPGAASGLLAVIVAAIAPELLSLADTGGATMTSTGLLIVPSGPLSRNVAFTVRSGAVITTMPLAPVVDVPAGCQARWPAARSRRFTPAPATPPDASVSWPVNASLWPATIRPLVTLRDRLACPVRETEGELPGCGEADAEGPGLAEGPWPRVVAGAEDDVAPGFGWCAAGTPANLSMP